jgi:hypothetical protein
MMDQVLPKHFLVTQQPLHEFNAVEASINGEDCNRILSHVASTTSSEKSDRDEAHHNRASPVRSEASVQFSELCGLMPVSPRPFEESDTSGINLPCDRQNSAADDSPPRRLILSSSIMRNLKAGRPVDNNVVLTHKKVRLLLQGGLITVCMKGKCSLEDRLVTKQD